MKGEHFFFNLEISSVIIVVIVNFETAFFFFYPTQKTSIELVFYLTCAESEISRVSTLFAKRP
jgi:hypothetical protein